MAIDILTAFEQEPPELDFVFSGFLAGTVGALVAPGASGKSWFALEMAMSIACNVAGGDLLNMNPEKHGKVLYLAGEEPESILTRRVHFIGKHLDNKARKGIAENLVLESTLGKRVDIMNEKTISIFAEYAKGFRLVVIDTLSRVHSLKESDNGDMSRLIGQFEYLAKQTGASVLFLHHANKGSALEGAGDQQQSARGASALIDNARWAGFIQKMTKDESERLSERPFDKRAIGESNRKSFVKFGSSKQNYAEHEGDLWFKHMEGGVLIPARLCDAKIEAKTTPTEAQKPKKGDW